MRCKHCDTPVGESDQFCTVCGSALTPAGGKLPSTIPAGGGGPAPAASPADTPVLDQQLNTMELASQVGARRSRAGVVVLVLFYLLLFGGAAYGMYAYLSRNDSQATLTLGTPRLVRLADEADPEARKPVKKKVRRRRPTRSRKGGASTAGKKAASAEPAAPKEEPPPGEGDHGSGAGEERPAPPAGEEASAEPAGGGGEEEKATPPPLPKPKDKAPRAGDMERFNAESVRMVIKHHMPQLRVCYERATKRGGIGGGVVDVQFTVSSEGKVSQSRVVRNTTGNINLGKCIAAAFKRWRFPRPAGGEAEFIYPFVFSSGG